MMNVRDLKDSVNSIYMKDEMRKAVIENVDQRVCQTKSGQKDGTAKHLDRRSTGWRKVAAAAVVLVAVSGFAAFPVRALVNSLVRERMEAMPDEEVKEIVDTEMSIRVGADSFSREYTDSEKARYQTLAGQYQAGAFPEKEIPKADSKEEVDQEELCFVVPDSMFYLPERELTDEEILEIIDFDVKRNYALEQNYNKKYADELAREEEEQKEQIADNVASGGITEQQAIEMGTEKLYDIFESTGEGMELSSTYSENSIGGMCESCYNIIWTNVVTHKIYYIDISAQDGRVLWASQTDPESVETPDIPIGEAKEKIVALQKQAKEFMQKMDISYDNVYAYYLEPAEGMVYHDGVRFVFEAADQRAYGVTYRWNDMMRTYEEVDFADYQGRDGKIRVMRLGGEEVEMKQVFQKLNAE